MRFICSTFGIPQILMPLAHDQFDNAKRIKTFGIGDSIPMREITSRKLESVLRPLLNTQSARVMSKDYSLRLQDRNGLTQSAMAIEERLL